MSWPALDEALLSAAASTYNFTLGRPVVLAVASDGAVLFRRTPPRSFASDLYLLERGEVRLLATASGLLAGGDERLSPEEKARRERTRTATRGVVDAALSEDGQRVLVPLGERLFLLERATGAARELEPGGYPLDPRLSPDGRRVAFVRGDDLWVLDVDGGPPRRLTHHPSPEVVYGTAEFAAQEELHRTRGYWWSPDGRHLLFQRTDNQPVDTLWVADAAHPEHAPTSFRYPRAGTANAVVDLGIVPVEGGEPRFFRWDIERWPYLAAVAWPAGGPVLLQVLDRDQTEIALLALDPGTGRVRPLLVERDEAWVNLAPGNATWLGDGFLWMTEAAGAWTLERHDADGRHLGRVAGPELGLRGILGLRGREVVVLASDDPRRQQVWAVPLDGGAPRPLTTGGGISTAVVNGAALVLHTLRPEGGVSVRAIRAGADPVELPSVAERPGHAPTTRFETVNVEGRKHYTTITRPRDFVPGRRYPVLLKVYGGPHAKVVLDHLDSYLIDQFYADAGFVVVRSDNRGTPDRGREWERAILRDLVTVPLADQVGALRAMGERHPELDLGRVGVLGWSFGGYLSTMAVLLRPEVFHAAVAGAPVTDWSLYDTAYTERYMKTPQSNPDGYQHSSALTHASSLSRPLLVLHGLTDDNVYFAHTVALMQSLYLAGKRAELVPLSGTHMVPDPRLALARERVQVEFFRQHLGPPAGE